MTEKLTPWFRGAVKPVRVGVYRRRLTQYGTMGYSYWDGLKWYGLAHTVDIAVFNYNHKIKSVIELAQTQWRGRANDPAAV